MILIQSSFEEQLVLEWVFGYGVRVRFDQQFPHPYTWYGNQDVHSMIYAIDTSEVTYGPDEILKQMDLQRAGCNDQMYVQFILLRRLL